jgi:hypothetical protein
MKIKLSMLILLLSVALSSVNLTGCSIGGHVGPVGAGGAIE